MKKEVFDNLIEEIRKKSLLSSFGLIINDDVLRDILKKYIEVTNGPNQNKYTN